jgi:hypothetical protein
MNCKIFNFNFHFLKINNLKNLKFIVLDIQRELKMSCFLVLRNISLNCMKILRKYSMFVYILLSVLFVLFKKNGLVEAASEEVDGGADEVPERYQVAKLNFEEVSDVYAITLWILLGSLAKVGFHLSHKLTQRLPESCLLIILGLIVGGVLFATKLAEQKAYEFNSETFFIFLLPPIILEAGYFMPNR